MERTDPVVVAIQAALRESQRKLSLAQASAERRLQRETALKRQLKEKMTEIETLRAQLAIRDEELAQTRKRAREEQEVLQQRVVKARQALVECEMKFT